MDRIRESLMKAVMLALFFGLNEHIIQAVIENLLSLTYWKLSYFISKKLKEKYLKQKRYVKREGLSFCFK